MLIVALVLAVIGLASLVTAVVTGNELIAWVCIGASVLGVILLIIDAIRERQTRTAAVVDTGSDDALVASPATVDSTYENFDAEYPEDSAAPAVGEAVHAEPLPESADVPESEFADVPEADVVDVVGDAEDLDTETEVRYVSAEDADSAMQVPHVSSDESDTTVEYVTEAEAEPADEIEDR